MRRRHESRDPSIAPRRMRLGSKNVPLAIGQVALAAAIFAADVLLPNNIAVGIPYVLVVVLAPGRSLLWVTVSTAACVALLCAGLLLAVDSSPLQVVATNRALTASVVCVTAVLVRHVGKAQERLRAQQADSARESARRERAEERFLLALDSSPSAMILVDGSGRIVQLNASAAQVFGYAAAELLGMPVEKLVPARFREGHIALRASFLRSPTTRPMGAGRDLFAVRRDGSEFPVEIGLNLMETNEGTLVLAAIVDVTERKRAEEDLHKLVEALPTGTLVVDKQGTIVLANRLLNELFGYERDELIGKPIETMVPPAVRPGHPDKRNSFLAAPVPAFLGTGRTLYAVRKDGTEFPVEIGLNPIETHRGTRVIAAVVDTTERTRAQRELVLSADELRRSNEDLDAFARVASHDLKAPLRAIESLSGWIVEDAAAVLPPASRQHLDTLLGRVQRMQRLLDDLLDYSRAGRRGAQAEDIDVRKLIASVAEILAPPRDFAVAVVGDLPAVRCARAPLEQVFRNLIDNSIKHHDHERGRVLICGRVVDGLAEFSVTDDGPGIPPDCRDRVFGMFQTLRPRDEIEGSGMGLALVRKVVQMNGGTICIADTPEPGARFVFTWRRAPLSELVG